MDSFLVEKRKKAYNAEGKREQRQDHVEVPKTLGSRPIPMRK